MTKKNPANPIESADVKDCSCGCQKGEKCTCGDSCKCGCDSSCNCCCKKGGNYGILTFLGTLIVAGAIVITPQLNTRRATLSAHAKAASIEKTIEAYIKSHPQTIIEATEKYKAEQDEAKKKAEAQFAKDKLESAKNAILADASNHSLGNPDGKYVVIEFFDYRCGWCRKTNQALWDAIDNGKAPNIRWVPVDSPIFGASSILISKFVLAAGNQGKFQEMHHAVVASTKELNKETLSEIAKNIGLDMDKLTADVESETISKKIEANMALAQELGISGVPFLIINGEKHPGALLGEALENVIAESNK